MQPATSMRWWEYGLCLVVAMLWGCNFVAGKVAMWHFPPMLLTALRFFAVALLLIPFVPVPKGYMRTLLKLSVTLGTLHFALVFQGIYMGLDIPTAVITTQMGVPFSCVLGAIMLQDKLGWRRIFGLVIAFLGMMLVAGTPSVMENWHAFVLVLAGAFFWALSNVQLKKVGAVPILSMLGWTSLMCAPQLLALSLLLEENQWHIVQTAPLQPVLGLLYSVVFSTIVAYGIWYYLLSRHAVSHIVPFSLLIPFFGITSGVLLLNEPLHGLVLLGGVITVAGVSVIVLRRPRMAPPASDSV